MTEEIAIQFHFWMPVYRRNLCVIPTKAWTFLQCSTWGSPLKRIPIQYYLFINWKRVAKQTHKWHWCERLHHVTLGLKILARWHLPEGNVPLHGPQIIALICHFLCHRKICGVHCSSTLFTTSSKRPLAKYSTARKKCFTVKVSLL